jgi:hypothetical protein
MRKVILTTAFAIGMLGLAACSEKTEDKSQDAMASAASDANANANAAADATANAADTGVAAATDAKNAAEADVQGESVEKAAKD